MLDRTTLLRAAAANHRCLFRRQAAAAGGRVERFGGIELVVAGKRGTIPFPRSRPRVGVDEVARRARQLRLREVGCWSLHEDPVLGTLLVARGWQWGWQPHWMALDLTKLSDEEPAHAVVPATGPSADDLPYAGAGRDTAGVHHLAVELRGQMVGHVVVNPWRGSAGIYAMGVVPQARRHGIGRALTIAACRLARELGCTHAVLNATGEGEPLYRSLGFESLGFGRTWWLFPGARPTARQTAMAEAVGFGDVDALEALRPTGRELALPLIGDMVPLALAVVTGQVGVAAWVLDRRPDLISGPIEPRGGTLLHVGVEWDNAELVRLALERGADVDARDHVWRGTPLDWAEHLGRAELAALLRAT